MAGRNWDAERARQEMARLTARGVPGFYALRSDRDLCRPRRPEGSGERFSIFVAEERLQTASAEPQYLGPRIKLKSLKDWTFGIQRYVKPIAEMLPLFDGLGAASEVAAVRRAAASRL
jgi:hypothetical protein